MINRRTFLIATAAAPLAAALTTTAQAAEPAVFAQNGVAIRGTDPVAYFTDGKPVDGSAEFTSDYMGATWQFVSAENRDLFESDLEAYAPQYGGYCAWAVAQGYLAPISPNAWSIHEGKLYLNANRSIRRRWNRDIPGFIEAADANWPSILSA